MSWPALLLLVGGAYGFKALGVFGLARMADRGGPVTAMVALIPAALITAIIMVQTLESDGSLQLDARALGLSAGVVAVWRKAPLIVVVIIAMAVTAFVRWQT